MKTIRTRRLELRLYRKNDHAAWAACVSNPRRRNRWDSFHPPGWKPTLREFAKVIARQKKGDREGRHWIRPIFERKSGAVLGVVDVFVLVRGKLQVANLGYRVDSRRWGEGIRRNYYYQYGRWNDQAVFVADRAMVGLPALKPERTKW